MQRRPDGSTRFVARSAERAVEQQPRVESSSAAAGSEAGATTIVHVHVDGACGNGQYGGPYGAFAPVLPGLWPLPPLSYGGAPLLPWSGFAPGYYAPGFGPGFGFGQGFGPGFGGPGFGQGFSQGCPPSCRS